MYVRGYLECLKVKKSDFFLQRICFWKFLEFWPIQMKGCRISESVDQMRVQMSQKYDLFSEFRCRIDFLKIFEKLVLQFCPILRFFGILGHFFEKNRLRSENLIIFSFFCEFETFFCEVWVVFSSFSIKNRHFRSFF